MDSFLVQRILYGVCWGIVNGVNVLQTLQYIYTHNCNQNLYNWALLVPNICMFFVTYFIAMF